MSHFSTGSIGWYSIKRGNEGVRGNFTEFRSAFFTETFHALILAASGVYLAAAFNLKNLAENFQSGIIILQ